MPYLPQGVSMDEILDDLKLAIQEDLAHSEFPCHLAIETGASFSPDLAYIGQPNNPTVVVQTVQPKVTKQDENTDLIVGATTRMYSLVSADSFCNRPYLKLSNIAEMEF